MELTLTTASGNASKKTVEVSEATFGREFNQPLVHQVVTAYMAAARAGTKAQKNRAERRGGGAKPWRQKGTGRARAGSIRSPIWTGGGVTFAASPRDYSQKVNRKMYRGAMRSILSELNRQERLVVVDKLEMDKPKTKELAAQLKGLGLGNVLIVTEDLTDNLFLSARNIKGVGICEAGYVDPLNLVRYEKVLVTVPAVQKIEEMLA